MGKGMLAVHVGEIDAVLGLRDALRAHLDRAYKRVIEGESDGARALELALEDFGKALCGFQKLRELRDSLLLAAVGSGSLPPEAVQALGAQGVHGYAPGNRYALALNFWQAARALD